MKIVYFEVWFQRKDELHRDSLSAKNLTEAKRIAKQQFILDSFGIVIDSWRNDSDGDIDDNSRKHWSLLGDGKTFKQY